MDRDTIKHTITTVHITHKELADLISDHVLDAEEGERFVNVTDTLNEIQNPDAILIYSFATIQDGIKAVGGKPTEKVNGEPKESGPRPQVSARKSRQK